MKNYKRNEGYTLVTLALGASALILTLSGCKSDPATPLTASPLEFPLLTGLHQVRDPITGLRYYAACDTCGEPTVKTLEPGGYADHADVLEASNAINLYPSKPLDSAASATAGKHIDLEFASSKPADFPLNQETTTQPASSKQDSPLALATSPLSKESKQALKKLVPFALASAALGPQGKQALAELMVLAKKGYHTNVRGRTDSTGTPATNRKIALERARAVRDGLLAGGVEPNKISMFYCLKCFIAPNDTAAGRRANRRVDVDVLMASNTALKTDPNDIQVDLFPLMLASR